MICSLLQFHAPSLTMARIIMHRLRRHDAADNATLRHLPRFHTIRRKERAFMPG
jgi:hypothetical protein